MEGSRVRKVALFVCIVLFGVITVGLLKLGFFDGDFKTQLSGSALFAYVLMGIIWGVVRFDFVHKRVLIIIAYAFGILNVFAIFAIPVFALPLVLTSFAGLIMLPVDIILTLLGKPLAFPFEEQ